MKPVDLPRSSAGRCNPTTPAWTTFLPAGSFEYLKTLAISRLMLDNFDNFQSSWVTQGPKIGQLSLKFGANDMGGTMIEENVVSKAGTVYCMPIEEI